MTIPETTNQDLNISTASYRNLLWINIEQPTRREMDYIAEHYPFHALDLDDCLSRVQRPKIDRYDEYLFMVFHFPVFSKQARVTTASQVAVFLGENYLITVHQGDLKPLSKFFRDCVANQDTRAANMSQSAGHLLYIVLDRLVNYCFPILNKIGSNIEEADNKVFSGDPRDAVRELSILRRDVLSYRRIIRPQTEVFEWLERNESSIIPEKEGSEFLSPDELEEAEEIPVFGVYFGDLADHNRKILDTLDEYKEVIEGLNDTNNTLVSFRTNQVMRILTIVSTIMLPPTLIASIYGMNIALLPLSERPISFPVIILIMLAIVAGMLASFRWKHFI
ncbi:MAG: magnesium transporter CorA family protein [Dehalococcoidia bacterium]